jgi:hypothetical protein
MKFFPPLCVKILICGAVGFGAVRSGEVWSGQVDPVPGAADGGGESRAGRAR